MDSYSDMESWALATSALHADDALQDQPDIAPPLHVTTTFRFNEGMTPLWERPSLMAGDVSLCVPDGTCIVLISFIAEKLFKTKCTDKHPV
jgi:hypothetical protein